MAKHKEMCSNKVETLREFAGLTLVSTLEVYEGGYNYLLLIFDDGYSMTFSATGAFWANRPEGTQEIVSRELGRIAERYGTVEELKKQLTFLENLEETIKKD